MLEHFQVEGHGGRHAVGTPEANYSFPAELLGTFPEFTVYTKSFPYLGWPFGAFDPTAG